MDFTTHLHLLQGLRMHELYIHSHILLHDVVHRRKYAVHFVELCSVTYTVACHWGATGAHRRWSNFDGPLRCFFVTECVHVKHSGTPVGEITTAIGPFSLHTKQNRHNIRSTVSLSSTECCTLFTLNLITTLWINTLCLE